MKIGVVADDITGANDIGSMFANGGYRVHVYTGDHFDPSTLDRDQPGVCIIDTNSRLDASDVAYRKVWEATKQLQAAHCPRFFNKTCSVFRGNIGVEFDAMLDALHENFAIVALGFPKNGRLTLDGVHFVHGLRLEHSPFRSDPIHPMTQSNLVDILQGQTQRRVGLVGQQALAQGADALRERIGQVSRECNYIILDVPNQAALQTIAQAVADTRVLCGSSALAEELPDVWGRSDAADEHDALPALDGKGVLAVAGSLTPQTAVQIDDLRANGTPLVEVDTRRLIDETEQQREIERAVERLVQPIMQGGHALVYAANDPQVVTATRAAGVQRGRNSTDVARLVTESLAEITAQTIDWTGARRLVVAGGETSSAVCRRLGVSGMRVWKEIQPGLPSCVTLTDPSLLLVLKSGSFGTADFLRQAIDHLVAQH